MNQDYYTYFGKQNLQKFVTGGPREKGWREYKLPTGESVFLDPRFKDQRYYVNEKGDHVVPDQDLALFDVQDNIWESGTSMPGLEIKGRASKKPGMLKAVGAALNPKNWGVDDYSQYGTMDEAFANARANGEQEFMWNYDRYNTRKDTDPINIDTSNPNWEKYAEALNRYPELVKLMNRGRGVNKINFEGFASAGQPNRAHYNVLSNTIGVGEDPNVEFIDNVIAEMAHAKDSKLDPANLNIPYFLKAGLERIMHGEDTYDVPGNMEYNTHRLYQPGIAMTTYFHLTPEKIKNIQNFLGVEADGYFGEQTFKALHDKYKYDPDMKRFKDQYDHTFVTDKGFDKEGYPIHDHAYQSYAYGELLHRDMGKKDKNSPFGWWFDLHETQRDGGVTYSNSKLQKFVNGARPLHKAQSGQEVTDPEAEDDPELYRRARLMGHKTIAEYRNSGWKSGPDRKLAMRADQMGHSNIEEYKAANWGYGPDHPVRMLKENPLRYMSRTQNELQNDFYRKYNANDTKLVDADKGPSINMTTGRYNTGKVSTKVIDEVVAAAKRQNVDPYKLLALAGRESTLGIGYSGDGHLQDLVSGWNVAEQYKPYEHARFLADRGVPGVTQYNNDSGLFFEVDDNVAVSEYLKQHPEIAKAYVQKIKATKDIGNLNSLDLAARWIQDKGISSYNPNDKRYESMVNEDMQLLKKDPALREYLQSIGVKQFGGTLTKFVGGGEHGGLDRWFAEKWVDVKTGKPCGRQEGESRDGYPACRPSKRVSDDTPKTASELSSSEREKFKRTKTSSERIPYQHRRKEDGGII